MRAAELEGALLDYWVARAEGYKPLVRIRRQRNMTQDGWGRNLDLGGFETVESTEWFKDIGDAMANPRLIGAQVESFRYSREWLMGGPIIEREKIATWFKQGQWEAAYGDPVGAIEMRGPDGRGATLLVAAMRAFVREKFGDEVPDMADAQPGSAG